MELRERIARALVRSYCDTEAEFDEQWADVEVTKHNAFLDADRVIAAIGVPPDRLEAVANGSAVIVSLRPIAWLHEIEEPDGLRFSLLSRVPDNPWSRWVAKHMSECVYRCTPLFPMLLAAAQEGKP